MMMEPKIKGGFFQQAILFAKKKLGNTIMDDLKINVSSYAPEVWYPYSDFCTLLSKISSYIHDEQGNPVVRIGYYVMNKDKRWQSLFGGKDPKEVFGTNKRQDALMIVGRFEITKVEDNTVEVNMRLWPDDPVENKIWIDFYQGILEGVLDLTSKEGIVEVDPQDDPNNKVCIYRVRWD